MAFKAGFVIMAPDGDPDRHRASIDTPKLELRVVMVQLDNVDQAVSVCRDLVQKEGVQSLIVCPGFTTQAVAKVDEAVGPEVSVNVARCDVPGVMVTSKLLAEEGWFPEGF